MKMKLFIGPCVLESETLVTEVAGFLAERLLAFQDKVEVIFKGSFDKANRTSLESYRGPGMEKGLQHLEKVKKIWKLPTITDFHLPEQAHPVSTVVDYLQVPAFLCRQTDMILAGAQAASDQGRSLNIKKGQFLSPEEVRPILEKAQKYLPLSQVLITERGTFFGYNRLVVDMTSFSIMNSFGAQTIHDATHCVQRPGSLGDQTGGAREYVEVLARAGLAAGAQGLFVETHPDPSKAKSDGATSLPLEEVPGFLERTLTYYGRF